MNIDLSGEDMGILIGKRGQTLDSLQYLVSLVVNKKSENYVRVKLDTENYRERRKETLETLAKNIAYKVKRTKRSVSLEPMNRMRDGHSAALQRPSSHPPAARARIRSACDYFAEARGQTREK